ncbi:hypothetical protein ASJ79_16670 [Mycobacterium sp. NAZ190054]|nr:hypothetical protein ASJ79_16670 [Mycobacterium sp. NAZ190054]
MTGSRVTSITQLDLADGTGPYGIAAESGSLIPLRCTQRLRTRASHAGSSTTVPTAKPSASA